MHRYLPLLLLCFGCGESITPVRGKILLDGKPVDKGTQVVFLPEGDTAMATAVTDENGEFRLNDVQRKGGLLPGTYKVVVSNLSNYVQVPYNASPDNPQDPVWDKYQKDLERLQSQPPKAGMLPFTYGNAGTTPLRYTAPKDGSNVVFDVPSGAAPK